MNTRQIQKQLLVASLLCATPALAQTNIDSTNKFAWSENTGWLNFRDAGTPSGQQGVKVDTDILSGFAWGENIGWINFGDGTPGTLSGYANVNGTDFGVNINSGNGNLSGLAWGENIGWINFGWALPANAQRPRLDAGRLKGFAWGENIGWINLDLSTAGQFVSITPTLPLCLADIAGGGPDGRSPDGIVDGNDFVAFVNSFSSGDVSIDPLADVAGAGIDGLLPDGIIDGNDFIAFINAFAAGC